MVNHKGSLAGWSDPGDPNYLDNLFARNRSARQRNRQGRVTRGFDADPQFFALMKKAARKRGITYIGYIRRSVAAFVAHDLDIEITDMLAYTPKVLHPGQNGRQPVHRHVPDDGSGYGPWKIASLEER